MQTNIQKIDWLFDLKEKVPQFLEKLKGKKIPGFFHYSLSGDLYDENINWGLGNSVFAVKIYYTINTIDLLTENEINSIINFIKGFQRSDGSIYDPLIHRRASLRNKLYATRYLDFSNLWGQKTKRAETRQSFSALRLLNSRPDLPYIQIPSTRDRIDRYLGSLNWSKPYDAGSHFSHLLFFLNINKEMLNTYVDSTDYLIEYAIEWVNKLQSPEDGSWYRGQNISIGQKINGAMKVLTGLEVANKLSFKYPDKLIDLCLSTISLEQACDTLDVLYVIYYANQLTEGNHRYNDIQAFCYRWLKICKEHYYPYIGGFSFFKHRANQYYYGAKITKGLNEPDIHGTVLLLWGIALVSQILGIDKELGFKEFIT